MVRARTPIGFVLIGPTLLIPTRRKGYVTVTQEAGRQCNFLVRARITQRRSIFFTVLRQCITQHFCRNTDKVISSLACKYLDIDSHLGVLLFVVFWPCTHNVVAEIEGVPSPYHFVVHDHEKAYHLMIYCCLPLQNRRIHRVTIWTSHKMMW